ncbi:MAG: DUF3291 domain-containing protein [Armatimonadetes bacterium]|nr:DUF3291 domain-containing protein [Armatimonadota bacterium]
MSKYHLAEFNVALLQAPIDDPMMADFVVLLAPVNALADAAPGFVWRLQGPKGDSTTFRMYGDEPVLVNMSVWEDIQPLMDYVYRASHLDVMRQKATWFEKTEGASYALWWIPAGEIPTPEEGKARLEYLKANGPSQYAFTFPKPFPAPVE